MQRLLTGHAELRGAKAHIIYHPGLGRPVYHALTPAKVNDIAAAKDLSTDKDATDVFDLGYYDFAWGARRDAEGCRIVTRFKTNTPLVDARDMPIDPKIRSAGAVLSRPHRLAAQTAGRNAQEPDAERGARDRRQDRDRQAFADP